jgi:hypothetical protein
VTAPAPLPVPTPQRNPVPVPTPVHKPCGLLGLRLFCPLTLCGLFGRFSGLCHS